MSAVAEKLTRERFREMYTDEKPYYELLDGVAVQKAVPTKLHSYLQIVLAVLLDELGFNSTTELTLAIEGNWEPIPDVCGLLGPDNGDPYPTSAVPVIIEILSPKDSLAGVTKKCRKYSAWGAQDVLVFDPIGRKAWYWDFDADNLALIQRTHSFKSTSSELVLPEVFRRLDAKISRSQMQTVVNRVES